MSSCQLHNTLYQILRGQCFAFTTRLVARQQATCGICRFQQRIDHFGDGRDFMASQAVKQRLHFVRQFRHIGKTKRGRTALDRVSAAKNTVELFIVGLRQIQIEQHLLHLIEIFCCLFKKDLIELGQVEIALGTALVCIRHKNSWSATVFPLPSAAALSESLSE